MDALAKEGSPSLPPGLGRVTIHGSDFQERSSTADLRDLYRVFLEESLKNEGQFTVKLEQDINALMVVVGLGPKEATSIREEVTSTLYRRLLREEVQSGRYGSTKMVITSFFYISLAFLCIYCGSNVFKMGWKPCCRRIEFCDYLEVCFISLVLVSSNAQPRTFHPSGVDFAFCPIGFCIMAGHTLCGQHWESLVMMVG